MYPTKIPQLDLTINSRFCSAVSVLLFAKVDLRVNMKVVSGGFLCYVAKPQMGMSDPKIVDNVTVCDGDRRPHF